MPSEASGVIDMMKRFRRFLLGSEPPDDRLVTAHAQMTEEAGRLRQEIASTCQRQSDDCGAPDDITCQWRHRRLRTNH